VNVLVKLSGSIACYKTCHVVSRLTQAGHDVRCAMSPSAQKFVGVATLEGLSGNRVATETFEPGAWMEHIELPRWADLTLLCPATANRLNKMAAGIADDLLGNLFLTHDFAKPYLVAPAMNTRMWEHPTTRASVARLVDMGIELVDPDAGLLACRETGSGRLADPDDIVALVLGRLERPA
jgi:phosphopantothenoylcysteine synthetase/decarboxylase